MGPKPRRDVQKQDLVPWEVNTVVRSATGYCFGAAMKYHGAHEQRESVMRPRFVAQQLSNPRGLGGWLSRLAMNRGNARVNAFALGCLDLRPGDSVMELGFGGGPNIQRIVESGATLVGVDRSSDVVAAAKKKYAAACASGRVRFVNGEAEALPLPDEAFSKALTVHTVYFWKSLEQGFAELHRILAPNGVLAVGFLPKAHMDRMGLPGDIFTSREPEDLRLAATGAGLRAELMHPSGTGSWRVLLCRKLGTTAAF